MLDMLISRQMLLIILEWFQNIVVIILYLLFFSCEIRKEIINISMLYV